MVVLPDIYRFEAITLVKQIRADILDAIWDIYALKSGAIGKRTVANAYNAVGDAYSLEVFAVLERAVAYARYAVGNVVRLLLERYRAHDKLGFVLIVPNAVIRAVKGIILTYINRRKTIAVCKYISA